MTTHPLSSTPAMAQVLRELAALWKAYTDGPNCGRGFYAILIDRAAELEAPEREAARPALECSKCGQPFKVGEGIVNTVDWQPLEHVACPPTPTETPPPAWDAVSLVARICREMYVDACNPPIARSVMLAIARAAHVEGQRAALGLPEEMPDWFWYAISNKTRGPHVANEARDVWAEVRLNLSPPAKGADQ